jgi:hypothetical protein
MKRGGADINNSTETTSKVELEIMESSQITTYAVVPAFDSRSVKKVDISRDIVTNLSNRDPFELVIHIRISIRDSL